MRLALSLFSSLFIFLTAALGQSIPGTVVPSTLTLGSSNDVRALAFTEYMAGTCKQVADLQGMTNIPSSRRIPGMRCYVASVGLEYRLVGGITDSNWVLMTGDGDVIAAGDNVLTGSNSFFGPIMVRTQSVDMLYVSNVAFLSGLWVTNASGGTNVLGYTVITNLSPGEYVYVGADGRLMSTNVVMGAGDVTNGSSPIFSGLTVTNVGGTNYFGYSIFTNGVLGVGVGDITNGSSPIFSGLTITNTGTNFFGYSIFTNGVEGVGVGDVTNGSSPIFSGLTITNTGTNFFGYSAFTNGVEGLAIPTSTAGYWLNVVDYGADTNAVSDSTSAIQAAMDAALTAHDSCTVYFPPGQYKISSAPTYPRGGQLLIPEVATTKPKYLRLLGGSPVVGHYDAVWRTNVASMLIGTVVLTNGESLLECTAPNTPVYTGTGSDAIGFNNVMVAVENLGFRLPEGTGGQAVNLIGASSANIRGCIATCAPQEYYAEEPTNTLSCGFRLPTTSNYGGGSLRISDSSSIGFYHGFRVSEHTILDNCCALSCMNGFTFDGGGHIITMINCASEGCKNQMRARDWPSVIQCVSLTVENSFPLLWSGNPTLIDDNAAASGTISYLYTTQSTNLPCVNTYNGNTPGLHLQITRLRSYDKPYADLGSVYASGGVTTSGTGLWTTNSNYGSVTLRDDFGVAMNYAQNKWPGAYNAWQWGQWLGSAGEWRVQNNPGGTNTFRDVIIAYTNGVVDFPLGPIQTPGANFTGTPWTRNQLYAHVGVHTNGGQVLYFLQNKWPGDTNSAWQFGTSSGTAGPFIFEHQLQDTTGFQRLLSLDPNGTLIVSGAVVCATAYFAAPPRVDNQTYVSLGYTTNYGTGNQLHFVQVDGYPGIAATNSWQWGACGIAYDWKLQNYSEAVPTWRTMLDAMTNGDLLVPSGKLTFYNNAGTYLRGVGLIHPDATYGLGFWSIGTGDLATDSNVGAVLRDSGYFGIKTNAPQAELHVVGNAIISGNLTVNGSSITNISGTNIVGSTYFPTNTCEGRYPDAGRPWALCVTNASFDILGFANLSNSFCSIFSMSVSNSKDSAITIGGPPNSIYSGTASTNSVSLAAGKMTHFTFLIYAQRFTNVFNGCTQQ